jgi:cysteine synthase
MKNNLKRWYSLDLYDLKDVLEKEGLMDKGKSFDQRFIEAYKNPVIRDILEIEVPEISDLTEICEIENGGCLHAVRLDLTDVIDNHKKIVLAMLILSWTLKGKLPKERINTIIDGGSYNSALATLYYAQKFNMKSIFVMSRFFHEEAIRLLREKGMDVIIAPEKYEKSVEKEFYEYLVTLYKDRDYSRNKICFWHAKNGGHAVVPWGYEVAEKLDKEIDYILCGIGSGATLEGLMVPAKDYFESLGKKLNIVAVEHELSSSFSGKHRIPLAELPLWIREGHDDLDYAELKGLDSLIIGPHIDEINTLIKQETVDKIDSAVYYTEREWEVTQQAILSKGISLGNSSAANLATAIKLANQGKKVVTVFFEPLRDFYLAK